MAPSKGKLTPKEIEDAILAGAEETVLEGGEVVYNVHHPDACKGGPCAIHNRSDHHMRGWPQHWRSDRQMIERICPHGVGHPDPDGRAGDGVHGCDGCCTPPLPDHEPEEAWEPLS